MQATGSVLVYKGGAGVWQSECLLVVHARPDYHTLHYKRESLQHYTVSGKLIYCLPVTVRTAAKLRHRAEYPLRALDNDKNQMPSCKMGNTQVSNIKWAQTIGSQIQAEYQKKKLLNCQSRMAMEPIASGDDEHSSAGGIPEKIGHPSVRSALTWIPAQNSVLNLMALQGPSNSLIP